MEKGNAHSLAEKIAQLLEAETSSTELTAIQASIDKINERLEKIENRFSANPHSALRTPQSIHPSLDRFTVIEAVADDVIASLKNEKACTFEPNGKPCDHCSMCSSRGF